METPIIEVKNISKKYNIAHMRGGYVALRDVIAGIFKRPLSFLAHKAKSAVGMARKEEFWALKDVSFEIRKGEVIGIIGRNGAGKSTLLKILSQITPPTEGEITLRGRVGSLLEVGTGFHPELTGRENIFLNGAILGMKKKEIAAKFDEIVAFAGVEKFLDTPVKRYSSGMYVRLAFSVAAHMEPDILIIDEVLAVGDAEFQKKCLGKMNEISQKEGRTVIFVSHNLAAVENLCTKSIWLDSGKMKKIGDTREVINEYLRSSVQNTESNTYSLAITEGDSPHTIKFSNIQTTNLQGSPTMYSHEGIRISFDYTSDFTEILPDFRTVISIFSDRSQNMVHRFDTHGTSKTIQSGLSPSGKIVCESGPVNLMDGRYVCQIEFWTGIKSYIQMMSTFDVITDITTYGFSVQPDKNVCDYLVEYAFTAEK